MVDLPGLLQLCGLSVVGHPQVVYMGQHDLYGFTHPLLLDIQTHSHIHYSIPLKIYFQYTVSSSTLKITQQLLLQNALICHTGNSYSQEADYFNFPFLYLINDFKRQLSMSVTVINYCYRGFLIITLCLYFSLFL